MEERDGVIMWPCQENNSKDPHLDNKGRDMEEQEKNAKEKH